MSRNSIFTWIVMILSSLVLLFILAPLVGMFIHTGGAQFLETVKDKEVHQSVWLTLWVSFTATLIFSIGAVPFAWLLARKKFQVRILFRESLIFQSYFPILLRVSLCSDLSPAMVFLVRRLRCLVLTL